MIVADDDRSSIGKDGSLEDLPWMNGCCGEGADGNNFIGDDFVFRIKMKTDEIFSIR